MYFVYILYLHQSSVYAVPPGASTGNARGKSQPGSRAILRGVGR